MCAPCIIVVLLCFCCFFCCCIVNGVIWFISLVKFMHLIGEIHAFDWFCLPLSFIVMMVIVSFIFVGIIIITITG